MGNVLRRLCGDQSYSHHNVENGALGTSGAVPYQAAPLGPHGVTVDTVGYAALARDLFQFEITGQVPAGLDKYVQSSKTAQAKWYKKLIVAWKAAQPPPSNAMEASQLLIQALQGHRKADVEGILLFYGLPPSPSSTVAVPAPTVVIPAPAALHPQAAIATGPWPKGVQYELHTLPADGRAAVDGDTLLIYVDTQNDPREAGAVPIPIREAVAKRAVARQKRDYKIADALQKEISQAGYKMIDSTDGVNGTLLRKYKIRLRGIDAPESTMPYGQEAKAMLQSLVDGKPLHLLVYNVDRYGRLVADVYCNSGFVQEILLKNGGCWYYRTYDKRQEFGQWEQEARRRKLGLWAEPNPEEPWEYRKSKR